MTMQRDHVDLPAEGLDHPGALIRYGHWGRPLLVFPSEAGRAWDYENNGMIAAVAPLIDAGRVKVYCVDSYDHLSWSNRSIPLEDRARAHQRYEAWLDAQVLPAILADSPGVDLAQGMLTTGCSMGAFHALSLSLRRADLFPVAICLSGSYDPSYWHAWGERGEQAYFTNPIDSLTNASGEHLDWLRSRVHPVLVVGQGAWETHPTGALPSTRHLANVLGSKEIPHQLDVWGFDVSHDWWWWQRQIAHHLPRWC